MSVLDALTRLERSVAMQEAPEVVRTALDAVRPHLSPEAGPLLDALPSAMAVGHSEVVETLLEALRKAAEGRPVDLVSTLAAAAGWGMSGTPTERPPAPAPATVAPEVGPTAETPEPVWSGAVSEADAGLLAEFLVEAATLLDVSEAAALRMEDAPDDAEGLNSIFRGFHTVKGVSACLEITPVVGLMHDLETLMDRVRKGQIRPDPALADLILVGIDRTRQFFSWIGPQAQGARSLGTWPRTADVAAAARAFATGGPAAPVAHLAAPAAPPPPATPASAPEASPTVEDLPAAFRLPIPGLDASPAPELPSSLAPAEAPPAPANHAPVPSAPPRAAPRVHVGERVVKLEIEKLDGLVDLVGELLVVQRMVQEEPGLRDFASQRLAQNLALLARVGRDLQRSAMSMRMVQLGATFDKMTRIVRDVARASGKQAVLEVSGAETELDRTVVDLLHDPLMHMVRNAVDHGLEPPADREAAGKHALGVVRLSAYHEGGQIVVELSDDGRGLDPQKLVKKAREKGLLGANEELTDSQAYNLIFAPGFSTAEKVTDISGRGVGMDVVRANIERIRGRVEIQSKLGSGTTFRIRLPITLAVIDGLIVALGDERYILPTAWVREAFRPRPGEVSEVYGSGEVVNVRGDLLPLVRLAECFGSTGAKPDPEDALVVVIESDGERTGLLVDSLVTKQEVVIKSLGDALTHIPGVSGAAILGDGRVGLIVDIHGLRPARRLRVGAADAAPLFH